MSRHLRTALGAAVVGTALLYLLGSGLGDSLVYYLTPSELVAKGSEAWNTPLRLSGQVEPGSIRWDADALELRFRVRDDSTTVEVQSSGIPPEMFHDGIEVILEGSLAPSGVFRAGNLMVKHSNEYGPDQGGAPAAERFRGLEPGGEGP